MKNTLHLGLRVKRAEESADGLNVHIDAVIEVQQTSTPDPKERIIKIGLPRDEEKIAKEFAEHAAGVVQEAMQKQGFMPMMPPKQFSAVICLFITKEQFNYLGRPTIDDYIELNARTDRRH